MSKLHNRRRAGLRAQARLHNLKAMETKNFHTKCISVDGNRWELWFTSDIARFLKVHVSFSPKLGKWSIWGFGVKMSRIIWARGWQGARRAARLEAARMMCRRLGANL